MREVHLHGRLLSGLNLFCLVHIETDRLALFLTAISVILVVRVVFTQLETKRELDGKETYLKRKLRNCADMRMPISSLYFSKTLL